MSFMSLPDPIIRADDPDPDLLADHARDYDRVAAAIAHIMACRPAQPRLEDVAAYLKLSPFHVQRLFKRWAGVSPKQFIGYLTLEHAKGALRASHTVLDAAFQAGLSGPSRLHDLFVTYEAMTPGEYKACGDALVIRHGVHPTPFGPAQILLTDRGVCGVDFIDVLGERATFDQVRQRWPLSTFIADQSATEVAANRMFAVSRRHARPHLLLKGTNFQIQVWSALLRIPAGAIVSYGDVARSVGKPTAARAVGTALADNGIAYLVPCHRVLRSTGAFENYRWSPDRRRAMLAWEAARAQT